MINLLHRELRRCVKVNDVDGYVNVFPSILDVFFGLHRPNYARWGTLFLQRLCNADHDLRRILTNGAFSVRRTEKNYSRCAIDLTLEQTVNRNSASQSRGIVAFRNSETSVRRWSITMTQRSSAVTELRLYSGLDNQEEAAAQCRSSHIRKDMQDPFDVESQCLLNVTTGHVACKETSDYLLNTLNRGSEAREQFIEEWADKSDRFLQPVKRTKFLNFSAENVKKKCTSVHQKAVTNAQNMRDAFIRLLVIIDKETDVDLRKILCFELVPYPLSIAHCDGSHVKTEKAALLRRLESLQTNDTCLSGNFALVYDGGLLLHSVISQAHIGTSYGTIARSVLSTACNTKAAEIHICFDK